MNDQQPRHTRSLDDLRPLGSMGSRPGSDRDGDVPAVGPGEGFVVEPPSAFGEVAEVQRAAGRDRHRGAPGTVRAPPQRVGEGVPVVEVADHRYRAVGLVGGQCEGNADGAVPPRAGCLDQLLSPVRRSNAVHAFDYPQNWRAHTGFNTMAIRRVVPVGRSPGSRAGLHAVTTSASPGRHDRTVY